MTSPTPHSLSAPGCLDGSGAGDHDVPYVFGRLPRAVAPFPFSTREFARLLVLRGRARAGLIGADDGCPSAGKPGRPAKKRSLRP
jgi:hypothetical protein